MTPIERAIEALAETMRQAEEQRTQAKSLGNALDAEYFCGRAVALGDALRTLRRIQKSTKGEKP